MAFFRNTIKRLTTSKDALPEPPTVEDDAGGDGPASGGSQGSASTAAPGASGSADGETANPPHPAFANFRDMVVKPAARPVLSFLDRFISEFYEGEPAPASDQAAMIKSCVDYTVELARENEVWSEAFGDASDAGGGEDDPFHHVREAMEDWIMTRVYYRAHGPPEDREQTQLFQKQLRALSFIEPMHLDLDDGIFGGTVIGRAVDEFAGMAKARAPLAKLNSMMRICKTVYDVLNDTSTSADEFLAVLIFLVLSAQPESLAADVEYILRFRRSDGMASEAGYYFTHMLSAVRFVQSADANSFTIEPDDFAEKVEWAKRQSDLSVPRLRSLSAIRQRRRVMSASKAVQNSNLSISEGGMERRGSTVIKTRLQIGEARKSGPFTFNIEKTIANADGDGSDRSSLALPGADDTDDARSARAGSSSSHGGDPDDDDTRSSNARAAAARLASVRRPPKMRSYATALFVIKGLPASSAEAGRKAVYAIIIHGEGADEKEEVSRMFPYDGTETDAKYLMALTEALPERSRLYFQVYVCDADDALAADGPAGAGGNGGASTSAVPAGLSDDHGARDSLGAAGDAALAALASTGSGVTAHVKRCQSEVYVGSYSFSLEVLTHIPAFKKWAHLEGADGQRSQVQIKFGVKLNRSGRRVAASASAAQQGSTSELARVGTMRSLNSGSGPNLSALRRAGAQNAAGRSQGKAGGADESDGDGDGGDDPPPPPPPPQLSVDHETLVAFYKADPTHIKIVDLPRLHAAFRELYGYYCEVLGGEYEARIGGGAGAAGASGNGGRAGGRRRTEVDVFDDTDQDDLRFVHDTDTSTPMVRAGTLERLVERLTFESFPDVEFLQAFLLTYRSFTSADVLMDLLAQRFEIEPPAGMSEADRSVFVKRRQMPIRLRVLNVLKTWIGDHFYDFSGNEELAGQMRALAERIGEAGMASAAAQLNKKLNRQLQSESEHRQELFILPALDDTDIVTGGLLSVDVRTLARVMTKVNHTLYTRVKPRECFGLAWSKDGREENSPNILALSAHFNNVSNWVQAEVLDAGLTFSDRVKVVKRFIRLAAELVTVNNFNGCLAVFAGLKCSAVHRLRDVWAKLDSRTTNTYESLQNQVSLHHSFRGLRNCLRSADPPCVPYLGMYLTDLTFIEDGNPDTVDGLINFVKRRLYANVIRDLQQFQFLEYVVDLEAPKVAPVTHFFYRQLEGSADLDADALYQLSLEIQPRQHRGGSA